VPVEVPLDQPALQRLAVLARRWAPHVLVVPAQGPLRFNELDRPVPGLSRRMMIERLRELEEAGLVERVVNPGPPITSTYQLTETGNGLRPALKTLYRWAAGTLPVAS
jgi:DNA-binding HxlR family transcriptional regulator